MNSVNVFLAVQLYGTTMDAIHALFERVHDDYQQCHVALLAYYLLTHRYPREGAEHTLAILHRAGAELLLRDEDDPFGKAYCDFVYGVLSKFFTRQEYDAWCQLAEKEG